MRRAGLAYGIVLIAVLALDSIWLSTMAEPLYRRHVGALLLDQPELWAAALFYLLYPVGVATFAVGPAVAADSPAKALGLGGLLGLIAYATYDLTNQATLRGWSGLVTVADIGWGIAITGTSSLIAYAVARRIRTNR